jgi:MFS family permease
MYPILMNHTARVLPRWLLAGALGWVAGVGTAGSAALPFLAGVLADKLGIRALQPLCVQCLRIIYAHR